MPRHRAIGHGESRRGRCRRNSAGPIPTPRQRMVQAGPRFSRRVKQGCKQYVQHRSQPKHGPHEGQRGACRMSWTSRERAMPGLIASPPAQTGSAALPKRSTAAGHRIGEGETGLGCKSRVRPSQVGWRVVHRVSCRISVGHYASVAASKWGVPRRRGNSATRRARAGNGNGGTALAIRNRWGMRRGNWIARQAL